ncbi:MAG TPA: GAF domain-containing sensor histidine kinase [Polyangiaceae bacterium]|jgi:signal transduction histidine kinase
MADGEIAKIALANKPFEAERQIAVLRLLVVGQSTIAYLLTPWTPGPVPWLAEGTLLSAVAYSLWMYLARPFRRWPILVSGYYTTITDGLFIVVWAYATGGRSSPFFLALYLSVFAVAFRYAAREALVAAAAYSAAYVGMLAYAHDLAGSGVETFTRVSYIFLAALIGSLMSRQVLDMARETSEALAREQRARALSAESESRAKFLAEASKALVASLDYEETLKTVARLAVPMLADACVVDLLFEDGSARRVAEAGRKAEDEPLLRGLRDYPPTNDGPFSVSMRTGTPTVIPTLDDVTIAELSRGRNEGYARILRALDLRTLVTVPLRVHGQFLGAMTFGVTGRDHTFSPEDLRLAEEVALRAALAIEHARLYRDAQEAIRTRDEFLSIASHELRTPLNVMMLQTDGLLRQARKEEDNRLMPAFERIKRQVNRLGALVESLLDVSRVTAGRLALDVAEVDLEAVVGEVVGRLREDAVRAGSILRLEGAPSTDTERASGEVPGRPPIVGQWDRMRIDQIVTNLVSNAIKYGSGKPINVRLTESEGLARIEVVDHGIGIGLEDQSRIFERFERAVSARHYGGFGLGLWIVRQIAQAHGGEISIRSKLGEGSTFIVELPLAGPPSESSNPPPSSSGGRPAS